MSKNAMRCAAAGWMIFLPSVAMAAEATPQDVTPSAVSVPTASPSYQLGPGDRLRITVYNEPTLSGEYSVTADGAISMPLIGNVPVAGVSLEALQQTLTERFATFVKEPRISVEPTTYRFYYILGEVNKPGQYVFSTGLKVEQAVAAAGGYTYRANRGTVFLRHSDDDREQRARIRDQRVPVQPGDTIRVGERFF